MKNDKPQAAHEKLQSAVEEIVSGDDWQRMCKLLRSFIATHSTTSA